MKRLFLLLIFAASAFAQTDIKANNGTFTGAVSARNLLGQNLNGDSLATAPTGFVLGIGDSVAITQGTTGSHVSGNLIVGQTINNNAYRGNTAFWGVEAVTGALNTNAALDGSDGKCLLYGTLSIEPANMLSSCTGLEGEADSAATGGQMQFFQGVIGNVNEFRGTFNANYAAAVHAGLNTNSGAGKFSGSFGSISDGQNTGNVDYAAWLRNINGTTANQLMDPGTSIDWKLNATWASALTMGGCPASCLVTVTDIGHGYSTHSFVHVLLIGQNSIAEQYEGFYEITVTDANHFTYVPLTQTSNASDAMGAQIYKVHTAHTFGEDGDNTIFLRTLQGRTNSAFPGFNLIDGDSGHSVLKFQGSELNVDTDKAGYSLVLSTAGGYRFEGGHAITGTIGGEANGTNMVTGLAGAGILTYTAISAQTCQEKPLTIAGAPTANFGTSCSPRATLGNDNLSWSAWVSSANTISVRVCNPSAGSITPRAVIWGCHVAF